MKRGAKPRPCSQVIRAWVTHIAASTVVSSNTRIR